jgi:hypothetical protein
MFDELISRIDQEIARAKERNRRIWFDHDQDISGIAEELRIYYIEHGYMIEIIPCRGCLEQRADIIISW